MTYLASGICIKINLSSNVNYVKVPLYSALCLLPLVFIHTAASDKIYCYTETQTELFRCFALYASLLIAHFNTSNDMPYINALLKCRGAYLKCACTLYILGLHLIIIPVDVFQLALAMMVLNNRWIPIAEQGPSQWEKKFTYVVLYLPGYDLANQWII